MTGRPRDILNVNGESQMYKGLIIILSFILFALAPASQLDAQVYKIVDENGNITYTDEPPEPGAEPMELPEISVIETDYSDQPILTGDGAESQDSELSPRELRRMYGDFQLLEPGQDQTYWGTENTVVFSWGSDAAYQPGMAVSVVVDGSSYDSDPSGNLPITLDRGEHQAYAILKDSRGRRIVTTDIVKFNVKQASRLINPG